MNLSVLSDEEHSYGTINYEENRRNLRNMSYEQTSGA